MVFAKLLLNGLDRGIKAHFELELMVVLVMVFKYCFKDFFIFGFTSFFLGRLLLGLSKLSKTLASMAHLVAIKNRYVWDLQIFQNLAKRGPRPRILSIRPRW